MTVIRRLGLFFIAVLALAMAAAFAFAAPMDVARETAGAMSAAVAKGDLDAIAALYAEDALVLFPNGKTISGREAIRKANEDNQNAGANVLKFGSALARGDDSQVSVVWTWELTITPQGKGPVLTKGRSLLYLQRVGDRWQIVFDMFQAAQGK